MGTERGADLFLVWLNTSELSCPPTRRLNHRASTAPSANDGYYGSGWRPHLHVCICEREQEPSSVSECSCGDEARARSDSQHPAAALNIATCRMTLRRLAAAEPNRSTISCKCRRESLGNSVPHWTRGASLQEAGPCMYANPPAELHRCRIHFHRRGI